MVQTIKHYEIKDVPSADIILRRKLCGASGLFLASSHVIPLNGRIQMSNWTSARTRQNLSTKHVLEVLFWIYDERIYQTTDSMCLFSSHVK